MRRRPIVAAVVTALLVGSLLGWGVAPAAATGGEDPRFAVVQDDDCVDIGVVGDGTERVDEFYDYRSHETHPPDEHEGTSIQYSSHGTTDLQLSRTSQLFVHDGVDGLSLVILHDALGDGVGGGMASFEIEGLPTDGSWVVEDDDYAGANDEWVHRGDRSEIDWFWRADRTDGGAFLGLESDAFEALTIDPQFNDAVAADHPDGIESQVDRWVVRGDAATVHDLSMDEPVTLRSGSCETAPTLSVAVADAPDAVDAGDSATVTVDVANDADVPATETVVLEVGGEVVDQREVTVDGGASQTVALSGTVDDEADGDRTFAVGSEHDRAAVVVDVVAPDAPSGSDLAVDVTVPDDPVAPGETLEVTVHAENRGDAPVERELVLGVGDVDAATEALSLEPGETVALDLAYDVPADADDGDRDVTATAEDELAGASITVASEPSAAIWDFGFVVGVVSLGAMVVIVLRRVVLS